MKFPRACLKIENPERMMRPGFFCFGAHVAQLSSKPAIKLATDSPIELREWQALANSHFASLPGNRKAGTRNADPAFPFFYLVIPTKVGARLRHIATR